MNVLVTGGSGFLGSHVVEHLLRGGHRVKCLVRRTSDVSFLETLGVELAYGSMTDSASLASATAEVDAVVHAAGLVKARGPDEFLAVNAGGTRRLCEAAAKNGVARFVLVSSLAAAGPSNDRGDPVPVDAPPRPVTSYGRSKLAAEKAALEHRDSMHVVVLRPPALYGPRDEEVLAFFRAVAWRVLPIMGSTDSKLSMLYGPDCAAACVKALHAGVESGSVLFVDDGVAYTFGDLVNAAEAALGKRAWVRVPLPERLVRGAARVSELVGRLSNRPVMLTRDKCNELFAQWVSDGGATRELLGWQPEVTFDEGARLTVAWYRAQSWL